MDVNKTLLGTHGRLWLNNDLLGEVTKFEAKVQIKYESIDVNNELCEQQRFTGYSISGTMSLKKIDSKILGLMREMLAKGIIPSIKLVSKISDPNVNGTERVELYNVTFDEFTIGSWENGKVTEENIPFKAGGFTPIDEIII